MRYLLILILIANISACANCVSCGGGGRAATALDIGPCSPRQAVLTRGCY